MKKILFSLALTLMAQGALACTPGVAGSGPHGDPNCMAPIFAQEQMMREQAQSYPSYNSGYYSAPKPTYDWGAMAVSPTKIVAVNNQASEQIARQKALQKCGNNDCEIIMVYQNSYAAVALGEEPNGNVQSFYYYDKNANVAKFGAVNACEEKKRKNCHLYMFEKSLAR